jgi:hypothetical protein
LETSISVHIGVCNPDNTFLVRRSGDYFKKNNHLKMLFELRWSGAYQRNKYY